MYGKIHQAIYDDRIVEDPMLRLVFMDIIILSDGGGVLKMTIEAFVRRTNIPKEVVLEKVKILQEPDANDTEDEQYQGRKIVNIGEEGSFYWFIPKKAKHAGKSYEEKREAGNKATEKWRNKKKLEASMNGSVDQSANGHFPEVAIPKREDRPWPEHLSKDKDKRIKVDGVAMPTLEEVMGGLEARLRIMFKRGIEPFQYEEQRLIQELSMTRQKVGTELSELETFKKKAKAYFPQSILSLLQGWQTTLDRARNKPAEPHDPFNHSGNPMPPLKHL